MNYDSEDSSTICISGTDTPHYSFGDSYKILSEIPSQGHNRLMRAERYGKQFALKGLKPEYVMQPQYVALLQKEFEIAFQLSHPNIARVYGYEHIPTLGPCIVMEYVEGRPLSQFLQEHPSMEKRNRVVQQILDAMSYYHSMQVVHRDLKPSNILVTHNGNNVRIIDFGCSDADQYVVLKQPAYTLAYASPEQLEGASLDCRSDIYNFGRVLQQIYPHRYRSVKRCCCRQKQSARYPNAEAVRSALFGFRRWGNLALQLLLIALAVFSIHFACHFNSPEFSYPLNDDIVLRCRIVDSKAVVTGTEKASGRMVLPEEVRYCGFNFPLTEIGTAAFLHCDSLTHVVFPENLRIIGQQAFYQCTHLSDTITLPVGLDSIGQASFIFCDKITTLVVRSARLHAAHNENTQSRFLHCAHLRKAYFDTTVVELGNELLQHVDDALEEIYVAEGPTCTAYGVFADTYKLRKLRLPNSLRSLGNSALFGSGIERLVLPPNIDTIYNMALAKMENCRYLELGPKVKYLDTKACYKLSVIDTLIFRAPVPPAYADDPFLYLGMNKKEPTVVFLVPPQSVEAYRADTAYARLNPQPLQE